MLLFYLLLFLTTVKEWFFLSSWSLPSATLNLKIQAQDRDAVMLDMCSEKKAWPRPVCPGAVHGKRGRGSCLRRLHRGSVLLHEPEEEPSDRSDVHRLVHQIPGEWSPAPDAMEVESGCVMFCCTIQTWSQNEWDLSVDVEVGSLVLPSRLR